MEKSENKYIIDNNKIIYSKLYDLYKIHRAAFWVPEEIRMAEDYSYFRNMKPEE